MTWLALILLVPVALGIVVTLASALQFLVVGLHGLRNHYGACSAYTPRVAFILPAWNEADVLGASIDSLMSMSYPAGHWRLYVVDDASTDHTPAVMAAKMAQYPGSVFHLRREQGGQGKAHTLNHGLRAVLAEDWAEAVMIMDADVLFEPTTLLRMVRHLADPDVGAVTAYVNEGSQPGNLLTRLIAFDYIIAQAVARRAQNVMGVLACMAGGAQLHSRANLVGIGGQIDTATLAEDTHTTFKTQMAGRRAVFEGNALVWAEEPDNIVTLWKQRLRWNRGNLQLSALFSDIWFRPGRDARFGGLFFGTLWFSAILMPVFALLAPFGLVALHFLRPDWAWAGVGALWGVTLLVFLFQMLVALAVDLRTARRVWPAAMVYPGLVALAIMLIVPLRGPLVEAGDGAVTALWQHIVSVAILSWSGLSVLAGWGLRWLERTRTPAWLRHVLLVLVGYGPLMFAMAISAMIAEWRGADLRWDKTVKSGRVKILK